MYQQMIVQGLVTSAPVIQYGQDGSAACEFGVKVVKEWEKHNKDEMRSEHWFRVRCTRALAEMVAERLRLDMPVLVVGEISVTAEQAAKGEKPVARMHIRAQSVIVVEGAAGASVSKIDTDGFGASESKAPKTAWDEVF